MDNGAKVINLSIGRSGRPAPAVHEAIAYAVSRGAFVVVAGGNAFEEGNDIERFAEFAPTSTAWLLLERLAATGGGPSTRTRDRISSWWLQAATPALAEPAAESPADVRL